MKYREMVSFLNENDIRVIQPTIALEVNAQLEMEVSDEEFEAICEKVYNVYLGAYDRVDIWELVDEELVNRGLKE